MTGPQKFKHGDTRADGWRFKAYEDGKEKWATPAAWRRYRMLQTVKNTKQRAADKGIRHDIDADYLEEIWPADGKCPALGLSLELGGHMPNSANLDRHIPSLGYVRGNVVWLSTKANLIKTDATLEELERVVKYLKRVDY